MAGTLSRYFCNGLRSDFNGELWSMDASWSKCDRILLLTPLSLMQMRKASFINSSHCHFLSLLLLHIISYHLSGGLSWVQTASGCIHQANDQDEVPCNSASLCISGVIPRSHPPGALLGEYWVLLGSMPPANQKNMGKMLRRRQCRSPLQGSEGLVAYDFLWILVKFRKVNLFGSELKIFWVVSTPTPENRLGQWLRNNWCSSQICFHTNQQWEPPSPVPSCAQAQALLPWHFLGLDDFGWTTAPLEANWQFDISRYLA